MLLNGSVPTEGHIKTIFFNEPVVLKVKVFFFPLQLQPDFRTITFDRVPLMYHSWCRRPPKKVTNAQNLALCSGEPLIIIHFCIK